LTPKKNKTKPVLYHMSTTLIKIPKYHNVNTLLYQHWKQGNKSETVQLWTVQQHVERKVCSLL